jgi:DNA-binding CsgD family transcriptional regulator
MRDSNQGRDSEDSKGNLRILMYGDAASEPMLQLLQRCRDGTVLFTEDGRLLDSLSRFAPHLVVCEVEAFVRMRTTAAPEQLLASPPTAAGHARRRGAREKPVLTEREQRVVDLVGKGFHNSEIAGLLKLHARTVKNVLSQLYLKFDVTNRTELIGSLFEQGLVRRPEQP